MTDTKSEILELLARRECLAQDLAAQLGMTAAGVRQHVAALEAKGLVTHRKMGGEPNRPKFLYRLSEAGEAAFPRRYDLLAESLLRRVTDEYGEATALQLVERAGADVAERLRPTPPVGSVRDQRRAVLGQLERELAWTSDTDVDASGAVRLTLYQCPFRAVSRAYPGVCHAFFTGLLRGAFGGGAVTCTRLPEGPACCQVTCAP